MQEKPRDEIVHLTELLEQPALPDLRLWQSVQQAAVSVECCMTWTNRPALTKVMACFPLGLGILCTALGPAEQHKFHWTCLIPAVHLKFKCLNDVFRHYGCGCFSWLHQSISSGTRLSRWAQDATAFRNYMFLAMNVLQIAWHLHLPVNTVCIAFAMLVKSYLNLGRPHSQLRRSSHKPL